MIDLHTHLLPGVDDGSPSVEVSLGVLQQFAADGVDVVVCTPHLRASQAVKVTDSTYANVFDALTEAAPTRPVLKRGWEIMLDVPGADLSGPTLTLAGSSAILVEFPRTGVPLRAIDELRRLRSEGRVPVLAHPERYWGCTLSQVRSWREGGTVMQIDAIALLAGGRMGEMAVALIEEGLADCLASDNHGDTRSLSIVRQWFAEQDAEEHAELLTAINPRRLLEGQPLLPVPPVRVRRGLLERLRELMRGRRR